MPQFLLEFISEEIPARMQAKAADDLKKLLMDKLSAHGLLPEGIGTFVSSRHLGAVVEGLLVRTADQTEERKGPRVDAPDAALQGFLRGTGLKSLDEAEKVEDKKGAYYVARLRKPGRAMVDILAEIVPEIVRSFPWPKSMRWGEGDLHWVRPLHGILALFDGEIVPMEVAGIKASNTSLGHRFHAPDAFKVKDWDDLQAKLRKAYVLVDREERKRQIVTDARTLCQARNLELVEDMGLLEEVAGLAEWPVVIMGDMDPAFLDLPGEVIRLTMRTHQKYFAVRDPKTGKLAPNFIIISNIAAHDGGKAIAAGNARVLSARLNDARFFWDLDRKKGLENPERMSKLKSIVFHEKLGTVWDKVERVRALAKVLCAATGADPALVDRAAVLMKADLVTETVGEFPELQGQIGRQSAELAGEHKSVCAAIEDHYRPLGPADRVPTDPVAVTLALADKIDSLVAFFAIGEKPTGSGDPYALRRAALGLVRAVLAQKVRLDLAKLATAPDLLTFILDRYKVQLRDAGHKPDLIDAILAVPDDDLVRIQARLLAVEAFIKTDDGVNLLAGFKRAVNILAAERKKDKAAFEADIAQAEQDQTAGKASDTDPASVALGKALAKAQQAIAKNVKDEDFAGALKALAALRAPVDVFFEKVLVNAPEPDLRRARLGLLSQIEAAFGQFADFGRLEG